MNLKTEPPAQETRAQALGLLANSSVTVAPETFTLVSLAHGDFSRLLQNAELSPRGTAPFMIFSDKHEVTLVLDDIDFATMRHALREAKTERGFRLLTFDLVMDFTVVGFLAEVTKILAESEISIFALSAFSRDHLLVKQNDLATTLKALSGHVKDVC